MQLPADVHFLPSFFSSFPLAFLSCFPVRTCTSLPFRVQGLGKRSHRRQNSDRFLLHRWFCTSDELAMSAEVKSSEIYRLYNVADTIQQYSPSCAYSIADFIDRSCEWTVLILQKSCIEAQHLYWPYSPAPLISLSSHYTMTRRSQSRPRRSRSRRPRQRSPSPIPRTRRCHRSRSPPTHRRHGSPPPPSTPTQTTNLPPLPRLRRRHPTPAPCRSQTWSQTLTQPLSETTNSSTLTQTLQITSHLHYTSAYHTPIHPPTTPTRSTATTPYSHITRHFLRYSTSQLSAPLQTNDHLEAQSPHSINHTQIATTTLPSTTGTIHPQPATTRQPHQSTASSIQTTSPNHTKVHQPGIHTPHITIQLPTHGLPHRPHADTTLSTQPGTISRHIITNTSTTWDPTIHEHTQLQTVAGDSYYGPTESKLASTTLATLSKPQHSTSHHSKIPPSPRRSPSTQSRNATWQCSGIPCQSNGHHGVSLQLHQIHLPPHLPEQEHLESSTHKTPGVITAPIHALRRLQICPRNIPKWDHRVFIAGMYSSQLQRYSGGGLHTHWLFLLGDLGPHTGCPPEDRGQSQSVS